MSRTKPITLYQATRDSPTLVLLSDLAVDSSARLKALEGLLPQAIRPLIKPGPIDGTEWCMILSNSAVAAKVRQLLPSLQAHLNSKGWQINSIRLKIQTTPVLTAPRRAP